MLRRLKKIERVVVAVCKASSQKPRWICAVEQKRTFMKFWEWQNFTLVMRPDSFENETNAPNFGRGCRMLPELRLKSAFQRWRYPCSYANNHEVCLSNVVQFSQNGGWIVNARQNETFTLKKSRRGRKILLWKGDIFILKTGASGSTTYTLDSCFLMYGAWWVELNAYLYIPEVMTSIKFLWSSGFANPPAASSAFRKTKPCTWWNIFASRVKHCIVHFPSIVRSLLNLFVPGDMVVELVCYIYQRIWFAVNKLPPLRM